MYKLSNPATLPASQIGRWRTVRGWLGRSASSAIVFAALGGLWIWGHHTGWKLPTFAALLGKERAGDKDWCEEHGVPDSQCVECHPELMPRPKDYGWCKVHGVPNCPLEHPDIAQLPVVPTVTRADLERSRRTLAFAERPENSARCTMYRHRLQFPSAEAVEKAGIAVEPVWQEAVEETVPVTGEIAFDPTRVVRLSSPVPGTVWQVRIRIGDPVKRGDVLALLDAPEVGRAKSELLQAAVMLRLRTATAERLRQGASPEQRVVEAIAAVSEAHVRLAAAERALVNLGLPVRADKLKDLPDDRMAAQVRYLGLPDELAHELAMQGAPGNLLPIVARLDGVVTDCAAVAGEVVDTSKVLFVAADPTRLWLTLNVRQEDAKALARGQAVHFRPNDGTAAVTGRIAWIAPAVDEKTRTVTARVEVANPDLRLRANTFGSGRVVLRAEPKAVVVPNSAIHWEGDCFVVFVRDKDFLKASSFKVFHTRTIRPGARDDRQTEIVAGLLPGEVVATQGSGVLLAELLRGKLGEG